MKLYRVKVPVIAKSVIDSLVADGSIEVEPSNRPEAELDLVAIMEEYLRRDSSLREEVREYMARNAVPYERYGKTRSRKADQWGHPTGEDVEKFLARQFIENFMISRFIEEVYADDTVLYKRLLELVRGHNVDERAIRDEARAQIKNISEGSVDYEIALSKAIKEVKKRHGLIQSKR